METEICFILHISLNKASVSIANSVHYTELSGAFQIK